jgi:hypothetical protein
MGTQFPEKGRGQIIILQVKDGHWNRERHNDAENDQTEVVLHTEPWDGHDE